jgi:hypothetical protein
MRGAVITAAKNMGLNVLRAPAFLDCKSAQPGTVPEGAWRGVCSILEPRNQSHGVNIGKTDSSGSIISSPMPNKPMRLILPLVNHWPDFGGMDRRRVVQCGFADGLSQSIFVKPTSPT